LTFNDPAGGLARIINGARQVPIAGAFLRLLVPFSNTPDRLIARGSEFIPGFGPIMAMMVGTSKERDNWKGFLPVLRDPRAIKGTGSMQTELMAKQIIGTMIALTILSYWDDDILTGPFSTDTARREAQQRQGYIPFAVKKGDTYYEYRRFEPMNMVVGGVTSVLTAIDDYQRNLERQGLPMTDVNVEDMTAMAGAGVANVMRFFIDSSYFSGVSGFFTGLSRPGGMEQNFRRQIASAVIPANSMLRNINRVFETEGWLPGVTEGEVFTRQNRNIGETFRRTIPGAAQTVEPVRDVFGQPRRVIGAPFSEALGTPTSAVESLVSPIRAGRGRNASIENEMDRLNFFPRTPTKRRLESEVGRRLDNRVFDRFATLRGRIFLSEIASVLQSPGYQRLSDEDKKKRLSQAARRATRQAKSRLGLTAVSSALLF
jgi:hypothetical protein